MCAFCVIFSLSSFPSPVKLYPKRQLQSRSFSTSANLPASRHSIMPSLPLSIFLTQSLLGSCLPACLPVCLSASLPQNRTHPYYTLNPDTASVHPTHTLWTGAPPRNITFQITDCAPPITSQNLPLQPSVAHRLAPKQTPQAWHKRQIMTAAKPNERGIKTQRDHSNTKRSSRENEKRRKKTKLA